MQSMMNKSTVEEPFDIEQTFKTILVEVLQKEENENPFKHSIEKYHSYAKMITDTSTLKKVLQKIKKANAKITGEIRVMEELERKEEEKKARDQAEAERNEKLKKELNEMYLSVSDHKEIPNYDDPSVLEEEVIELNRARKQKLIQYRAILAQLLTTKLSFV